MPFTDKEKERLSELLEILENAKKEKRGELTYAEVGLLKEIEGMVNARIENGYEPDRDLLVDSISILRYVAYSYDMMGRQAVSSVCYKRAIQLMASLYRSFEERVDYDTELLAATLKARNCYIDDSCDDIGVLCTSFMEKDEIDETFCNHRASRRIFRRDPVEMTPEYLAVIDEVEERIEKNRRTHGFGSCHETWSLKQEYLAEKGIAWRSPVQLNPRVRFD
ncbi:MAG: hypothetical protein IJY04_01765 [Clostridia bacterium]|nr:hypothetical protein [Clostridia bacterium]